MTVRYSRGVDDALRVLNSGIGRTSIFEDLSSLEIMLAVVFRPPPIRP
jgi:hypothetical protein